MSGAHFRIDQAANIVPTGTVDTARVDVWQDRAVLLVATDTVTGSPQWTLLSGPVGASLSLSGSGTNTATLSAPKPGSYLCEYLVGDGAGANAKRFVIRVTRDTNGLIIDDGQVDPAFQEEEGDDNAGGNTRGWDARTSAIYARVVPSIANVAALILRTGSKQLHVNLLGYYTAGDGGEGAFRWDATSTAAHDYGTIFQPGFGTGAAVATGRWIREDVRGELYASWYGVLADGKYVTDGVVTAGLSTLTSASAAFTAADTGKRVTPRLATTIATGTVSSSGATLNGTGTAVATDMPIIVDSGGGIGQPLSGGGIYCDGQWLVASFILTATQQMQLRRAPSPAITAKPYYREVQIEATLTYSSATVAIMSSPATISQTGVLFYYGTDNTTALKRAYAAAKSLGIKVVRHPAGFITYFENTLFQNYHGLTLIGPGMVKCCLVDARKASTYYTSGPSGMLSFDDTNSDIHILDISLDANLPMLGIVHSSVPGVANASGRRIGFWMQGCKNSSYRVGGGTTVGAGRYGARDEHAYIDGQCDNFIDTSVIRGVNNVCFNCNGGFNAGGFPQPENLYVGGSYSGLLLSAGSCIVDQVDISPEGVDIEGAITCDLIGHMLINGGSLHDFHMEQGVGMVDLFGNHRTDSSFTMRGTTFARNTSVAWHSGGGASVLHMNNFGGVADISGLVETDCSSVTPGGRHIVIEGSGTGRITIRPCTLDGGSNISIGIKVVAGVPDGAVAIQEGHRFGASVTLPFDLGAALATLRESVTL